MALVERSETTPTSEQTKPSTVLLGAAKALWGGLGNHVVHTPAPCQVELEHVTRNAQVEALVSFLFDPSPNRSTWRVARVASF